MKEKQYFPTINFLRGIAALLVCIYHFTNFIDYRGSFLPETDLIPKLGKLGIQGVYVFFVITGFVIPLSMYQNQFVLKRWAKFLSKRWVRIEIPYLISILATFIIWYLLKIYYDDRAIEFDLYQFIHHVTYTITFTDYAWYNSIYWTLAIEFQFYILMVFIFPLLVSKNAFVKSISLVALCILALVLDNHRFALHFMPVFGMGIVLFWLKTDQITKPIASILFGILLFHLLPIHGLEITITAILTTCIIWFFNWDFKLFNWLGNISYSLYLIHGMIGGTIMYMYWGLPRTYFEKIVLIGFTIACSLIVSTIFWQLVERPSKKLAKRIGKL